MTVILESVSRVCWRCGGAKKINNMQDRCPGCAGTGLQAYQRPRRQECVWCDAVRPLNPDTAPPCPACGSRGPAVQTEEEWLAEASPRVWQGVLERIQPTADACPSCGGSGYRVYQREVPDGSGRIETVTEPCSGPGPH